MRVIIYVIGRALAVLGILAAVSGLGFLVHDVFSYLSESGDSHGRLPFVEEMSRMIDFLSYAGIYAGVDSAIAMAGGGRDTVVYAWLGEVLRWPAAPFLLLFGTLLLLVLYILDGLFNPD